MSNVYYLWTSFVTDDALPTRCTQTSRLLLVTMAAVHTVLTRVYTLLTKASGYALYITHGQRRRE